LRNSTILFLAAVVILVWFGSEVFTAQELCATTCISLSGLSSFEDAVVVAVVPILLVIGGYRVREKEMKLGPQTRRD
jgi:membrane protein implicated in regulation of membrane protease activity